MMFKNIDASFEAQFLKSHDDLVTKNRDSVVQRITTPEPTTSHPARDALHSFSRLFPTACRVVDKVRDDYLKYCDSNASCYAPVLKICEALREIVGDEYEQLLHVLILWSVFPAWRMSQTVVRFDPTLYESLVSSDLSGDIPAQVFSQMPFWAIYIETPGLRGPHPSLEVIFEGVFVSVQSEKGKPLYINSCAWNGIQSHCCSLRIIEKCSLHEMIEASGVGADAEVWLRWWTTILNLLIYVCTQQDNEPPPKMPQAKKTRRNGVKIFPPKDVEVWEVGVRIGAILRSARSAESATSFSGTGPRKRPHIRRAHWHTFRHGPMKLDGFAVSTNDRPFRVDWIPPIAVNLTDPDSMPTVIRKVVKS